MYEIFFYTHTVYTDGIHRQYTPEHNGGVHGTTISVRAGECRGNGGYTLIIVKKKERGPSPACCPSPHTPTRCCLALLSHADPAEAPMVAEGAPRQIASGLRDWYTEEQMLGTRLVVLCNLKPRSLRGFK